MTIEDIIESVLRAEGRYVNNPDDRGGETNWGITKATARAHGYNGPMRDLPRSTAKQIYLNTYVVKPGFDKIAVLSPSIAAELVDTGVNMGPTVAARFLQRALNVLNDGATRWPDLTVDGVVGPMTVHAFAKLLQQRKDRGERAMLNALNSQQVVRYMEIAEARPKDEAFVFGWLDKRVEMV